MKFIENCIGTFCGDGCSLLPNHREIPGNCRLVHVVDFGEFVLDLFQMQISRINLNEINNGINIIFREIISKTRDKTSN